MAVNPATAEETDSLIEVIIEGIREKKGFDITVLDLRGMPNVVTDAFVICSGNSDTQTKAIADEIERKTREQLRQKPWHTEGGRSSEWLLLDYVNVVVHVFIPRIRSFYNLEELWGDAIVTHYKD